MTLQMDTTSPMPPLGRDEVPPDSWEQSGEKEGVWLEQGTNVHVKRVCALSAILLVAIEITLRVHSEATCYVAMIVALGSAIWTSMWIG
jgi:hypothetical protein